MATTTSTTQTLPNNTNTNLSFSNYLHSLSQTPHRLRKRMLATWTPDQELNQVRQRSGADMKRKLKWYDLMALGVGGMLGVGVFVTTGSVAHKTAGPSVFISYIIAGISALLSSLCYTEFSVQIPVAGGAFSYLRVTFGEFVGYFAGANILMEYVLSNAAVARSFTEYLSSAFGQDDPKIWRVEVDGLIKGYNMLDFPAVALILLLTFCLCHSTKESSTLNLIMTVFHVVFFGFIIIAGFCIGSTNNLVKPKGLAPFGVRGVLDGAAIVYFSYIGYDSASTMAEEIQNPSQSLPVGIIGSVVITSLLYCLMALSLCFMVPYNKVSTQVCKFERFLARQFDKLCYETVNQLGGTYDIALIFGIIAQIAEKVSFSVAFRQIGWDWASNVVGAGASLGIVASLLVAMLGQARYLCVIGRARLVPSWLAKVHPATGTPLNATLFLGLCTASIALFTDLEIVIEMISIGTLLVFYLVANALIYRRYVIITNNPPFQTLLFLFLLSSSAIGFSMSWKLNQQRWGLPLFGMSTVTIIAFFKYMVPCVCNPTGWSMPFMPWPAALSIFLNVFLMTTLKKFSFERFAIWACFITLFYLLYGVHSTYKAEEREGTGIDEVNPRTAVQQIKLEIQVL
uniref:cationic amino acid transporter 6, chloroplastic-like isoform X1 n=1 Tax=Fragaria vesca subsp. vesca TaxID=101020 RepID=UPI0005CA9D9C|nr:PREDICTED: cationic amino acid transporter 6, chloroplastic-like isoform X1 [Fragaria vesca subsp. vesca]